jgi:hypothetical protein
MKPLRALADGKTPACVIGAKLGRTEASVRSKAYSENIPLKLSSK